MKTNRPDYQIDKKDLTPEEIQEAYETANKACNYYKTSFEIYNIDREDIIQDAIYKVVKNFHTFRGESLFKTWVYRITCNTILNAITAAKTRCDEYKLRKEFVEEDVNEEEDYYNILFDFKDSSVESATLAQEKRDLVLKLIDELPDHLKYVITCRLKGVPYSTLAKNLGIHTGTVRTRVFAAKRLLMEKAKKYKEYF